MIRNLEHRIEFLGFYQILTKLFCLLLENLNETAILNEVSSIYSTAVNAASKVIKSELNMKKSETLVST